MKYITILLSSIILCTACHTSNIPQDPIPVHSTYKISSKILNEDRVINVWTPLNYDSISGPLAVVYMPDGGVKEDFPHIANTISQLIQENKIPPAILVGIENTQRRRDLSGITLIEEDKKIAPEVGGSEKFRNFIKDELFPLIASKYRINDEQTLLGESLAGLFVIETMLLYPDMFDNYIAFDPSLWWNNHQLVKDAPARLQNFTSSAKKVWFAGSNATDINVHTKNLAQAFKDNASPNIQWKYVDAPQEKHATIFRATKTEALIWTLKQ